MSTTHLDRFLEPVAKAFTPEVARSFLSLRADDDLQAHIDELRRKANDGSITPAEDEEYKNFVEAVDVIGILQAKARRFLTRHAG